MSAIPLREPFADRLCQEARVRRHPAMVVLTTLIATLLNTLGIVLEAGRRSQAMSRQSPFQSMEGMWRRAARKKWRDVRVIDGVPLAAAIMLGRRLQDRLNLASSRRKTTIIAEATWGVQGIAFNPAGTRLALMGSMGANLQLFCKTGPISALPRPHHVVDRSVAFLDNRRLVIFPTLHAPADALVDIVDVDDPDQRETIIGDPGEATALQSMARRFSVSGDRSLVAMLRQQASIQTLILLDAGSGTRRSATINSLRPLASVTSLACSHDGRFVALGLVAGGVLLVEAAYLTVRSDFDVFSSATLTSVAAISISPDGTMVATGPSARCTAGPLPDPGADPRNGMGVKLWRMRDGGFLRTDNRSGTVRALEWSTDSNRLAIARDRSVTVLDAATGRTLAHIATRGTSTLTTAPDGRSFVFGDGSLVRLLQIG